MSNNEFSNKIHPEVKKCFPYVEAVTELFHPFVEGAVHDLTIGKVVAIYNNFSKRNVGDTTPLHELKVPIQEFPDYFTPYYKDNWDGKQLKCTSITIRDDNAWPIGLICFNIDVSFFIAIENKINSFLRFKNLGENPVELFEDDWRHKIKSSVDDYLQSNKLNINNMKYQHKKELVRELYQKGLFNYKYAANYLAEVLKVSRASVYNYLK